MPNLTLTDFRGYRIALYLASLCDAPMSSNFSGIEIVLTNLIHDLRQPLANIEGSSCYLASLTRSGDARIQELARIIERQVEQAEQLLAAASVELSRVRVQREEQAVSLDFTNSVNAGLT